MSLEVIIQRPSSSSSKEQYYSSERERDQEASSRLTARLERSVNKRSKGLHYHDSAGRSRRRERHRDHCQAVNMDKGNRRERHEMGRLVKQTPFCEGRGDSPEFRRKSDPKENKKQIRPQSWYGSQVTERKPKERPQSIHEISFHRDKEKNSFNNGNEYSGGIAIGFRDRRHRHFESSRSLSSSYSSQVGSSADECDDHHGVYSAYDMTGRSPYGSLMLRRYSQSSLSSSSASWQQSTNSLTHHAVKGQLKTGTLTPSSTDKLHGQTVHKAVFPKSPPKIFEDSSTGHVTLISETQANQISNIRVQAQPHMSRSHVYAQPSPYSSSHLATATASNRAHNHSVTNSTTHVVQNVTQFTSKHTQSSRNQRTYELESEQTSPSVKDLAKRFSGENQEFFSESFDELYERNARDRRRVTAQAWPKLAYVHAPTDHTVRVEGGEDFDCAPPKPPYPQTIVEDLAVVETKVEARITRNEADVQLRSSDVRCKVGTQEQSSAVDGTPNPDALASHRLSLQELIEIHENKIAKHAQSAKATAHAQIYLKRPASEVKARNVQSPQTSPRESQEGHKQSGVMNRAADTRGPVVAQFELTNLKSVERAPIKVVEVTKKDTSISQLQEKVPVKSKRHRTIGVVGFRHQIDRVSEGKAEQKPKRHTAIGIVSAKAEPTPARQIVKEETVVVSHACYSLSAEEGGDLGSEHRETVDMLNHRKEYDFHPEIVSRKAFQEDDVNDDVFERDDKSFPYVRSEGILQPRSESDHDRERQSKRNDELPISIASPNKPVKPVECISTQSSNSLFHKADVRTWSVPVSSRAYNYAKPYVISKAVPVAQVSPVNPPIDESSVSALSKENFTDNSPLSRSQSAREMYETRLALWNLYPPDPPPEIHSSDTSANTSRQQKVTVEPERNRVVSGKALEVFEQTMIHEVDTKIEPRGVQRQNTEEYYVKCIEKLKTDNKELIAKYEAEKRELKQKYEEQRKVANAYQKLEDRYRRRVHELQEALSGCTCQSHFVKQNHVNMTHGLSNRSEKEGDRSASSSIKGIKTVEELDEWLSEHSKGRNPSKKNNTASRNSLVSTGTSSEMTGSASAWDELYDRLRATGEIDVENGTHV